MKNHVLAFADAAAAGYSGRTFAFALSAMVKTPASASRLPELFSGEQTLRAQFEGFIGQCRAIELAVPASLAAGASAGRHTVAAGRADGAGYDAIDALSAAEGAP